MAETVTPFAMGADVPEWLVSVEPRPDAPHRSKRGKVRFGMDVEVLDLQDRYVIAPAMNAHAGVMIDLSTCEFCVFYAASKPVYMARAFDVLWPQDVTPLTPAGSALEGPVLRGTPAPAGGYVAVPDPHPTFWSRLLYVLRGR